MRFLSTILPLITLGLCADSSAAEAIASPPSVAVAGPAVESFFYCGQTDSLEKKFCLYISIPNSKNTTIKSNSTASITLYSESKGWAAFGSKFFILVLTLIYSWKGNV